VSFSYVFLRVSSLRPIIPVAVYIISPIFYLKKEIMEFVSEKDALEYPDYDMISSKWGDEISPWIEDIFKDIKEGRRKEAAEKISEEKLEHLFSEKNSSEKAFDLYGVSVMLTALNEHGRAKKVLIELSKLVSSYHLYVDLSVCCRANREVAERLKYMQKADEMMPGNPGIRTMLGSALVSSNRIDEGLEIIRKAVEESPDDARMFSNYLFNLHYKQECDCEELFYEHKRWAKRYVADKPQITNHKNDPDPKRKIRIGYISPDLKTHPVGLLIRPIIEFHNRDNVEVFSYGKVSLDDAITQQIKNVSDHYRGIYGFSGEKIVKTILADEIDILVDLAGHTGSNCLRALASKPAPVQATYLGYFDTTGMEQVDYFLTDRYMSPPETQKYHTEELIYFPETCFCYNLPNSSRTFDIIESPVIKNGYITFGMYSNPAKINPSILSLWAKVMCNLPSSRLEMIIDDGDNDEVKEIYLKKFEAAGVAPDRINLCGKSGYGDYLDAYNKVDIIFDTSPYCGGATTCDAFCMGVPVISLVGEHHFSRVGFSLLSAVGLDYFAAKNGDEYVAKATALASKPQALNKIRFQLRQRMMASDMCNPKTQAKNMEDAYRKMWRRWCREKQCLI